MIILLYLHCKQRTHLPFTRANQQMAIEQPYLGFLIGSMVYLGILVVVLIITSIVFRKGQTCYANNFAAILIVMAYIMWACVYMCQMFPLVAPELTEGK